MLAFGVSLGALVSDRYRNAHLWQESYEFMLVSSSL